MDNDRTTRHEYYVQLNSQILIIWTSLEDSGEMSKMKKSKFNCSVSVTVLDNVKTPTPRHSFLLCVTILVKEGHKHEGPG